MWKCPKCSRIFQRKDQPHSCKTVPIEEHFQNKDLAKEIFNNLVEKISHEIGKSEIISLPCCVHLFGEYDYLAALPKKGGPEVRFALGRIIANPRLKQSAPLSQHSYKNCIDIESIEEIDEELISWIRESYLRIGF